MTHPQYKYLHDWHSDFDNQPQKLRPRKLQSTIGSCIPGSCGATSDLPVSNSNVTHVHNTTCRRFLQRYCIILQHLTASSHASLASEGQLHHTREGALSARVRVWDTAVRQIEDHGIQSESRQVQWASCSPIFVMRALLRGRSTAEREEASEGIKTMSSSHDDAQAAAQKGTNEAVSTSNPPSQNGASNVTGAKKEKSAKERMLPMSCR